MKIGRPKSAIILSKEEVEQLKSITNSCAVPHGLVRRACIILMGYWKKSYN